MEGERERETSLVANEQILFATPAQDTQKRILSYIEEGED